jgi:bifunctional non-homologous end joining protein LigD
MPRDVVMAGITLTHPDRVLYPAQGITKRLLASFYEDVADWILPYVRRRPISLVRCPHGHDAPCFFQKHANDSIPAHLKIHVERIRDEKGMAPYLFIEDVAGLISLVQLGVLEIHPWGARIERLEHPDTMTFDLDPSPEVSWGVVVDTAHALRLRLQALGLESFVKTTGGKGLHVVVPLAPHHRWNDVKAFARSVAAEFARLAPTRYTMKGARTARLGKVLIDYLRNSRGATVVAPYSTRAKPGAPVATPVDWSEVTPRLRPDRYTVANLRRRLRGLKRDPWKGYFDLHQRITARAWRELSQPEGSR